MTLWLLLAPLLGAAACALVPAQAARLNILASGITLVLALLLLQEPFGTGWLRTDALNLPFVIIAAIVGLSTAVFSAQDIAGEGFSTSQNRAYHVAFQGFMAAHFLALLADNLGVMWVAIEAATLACVLIVALHRRPAAIEAAWKFFILCGVGIALALFGLIVLALAAQPLTGETGGQLSFTVLRALAARADPGLLNLAFVFLLVGFGTKAGLVPLHSWLPDAHAEGPTPIAAVLSGLLLNAAMLAILRGKSIVAANPETIPPGIFLMIMGGATLLLAAFSLWRRRDAKRLFGWSSIEHMGIVAIAFGVGGAAATMAGLLHLWGHSLVKSAAFFAIGRAARIKGAQRIGAIGGLASSHPALGWGLVLAMTALAGLPPFSLFASEFLLASAIGREAPWLLPVFLLGLLVAGMALLHAMQRLCFGAPTPEPAPMQAGFATLVPLWAHLVLALILALALPAPLSRMLLDAARLLA